MQHFKYLLLLLFIVALNSNISAQSFGGGIRAGISGCGIDAHGFSGHNKLGYTIGFFVNNSFSSSKAFQLELLYTLKGEKNNSAWINIGLHYVEIPFLFNYNFSKIAKLEALKNVFFVVGFAPAVLIGTSNQGMYTNAEFSKIDLAAMHGLGYNISKRLSYIARVSYTILGISPLNIIILNHCITFSLSYHIK